MVTTVQYGIKYYVKPVWYEIFRIVRQVLFGMKWYGSVDIFEYAMVFYGMKAWYGIFRIV